MNNFLQTDWSKWKLLGLVVTIQAVSFLAGLYSGHTYWPKTERQVIQANYSTTETGPTTTVTPPDNAIQGSELCPIKGNISGKNKIYHVTGGAFFERTQAEMCFTSEAEAQAAGFIKSSRWLSRLHIRQYFWYTVKDENPHLFRQRSQYCAR